MQNLKILDVSGNFLYQFNAATIEPLKKLEVLLAANNTWTCNGVMKKLARHCTTRNISCSGVCQQKNVTRQKFERMISKVSSKNVTFNGFLENTTQPSIRVCDSVGVDDGFLKTVAKPFYLVTVFVSFAVGIAMGLLLGCWMRNGSRNKNNRRKRIKKQGRPLIANCDSLGMSTPVMYRKFEVKT